MATPIAVLAVSLLLPACGGGPWDDAGPVTIGGLYPMSGRQGPGGVDEARGAQLAVELANDRGTGAERVRLDIVDVDNGADAPQAMAELRDRGVRVVLGSYGSTISAPAAVAAHEDGMLLWETGAVGQVPKEAGPGQSFFRMAPMGGVLGRGAVTFVAGQLAPLLEPPSGPDRHLRYAVAYVDDAYGRAVGLGAADEILRSGQVLAGSFPYDVHRFDAADLVRQVAESRPDVLFVSAYLDDGVAIRRATLDADLPLLASIGTSSSYCMPEFGHALGPGAVGLFASDKPDGRSIRDDVLSPDARAGLAWAKARYQERHGQEMSAAALSGFANTWALVGHVLPAAGNTEPSEVAAAARRVKLEAGALPNGAGLDLAGPDQADAGENRAAVSVIWQWVAENDRAVVWPPTFASRPLSPIPIQR